MIRKSMLIGVAVGIVVALGAPGYSISDAASSSKSGGKVSGTERQAQDIALTEIGKHWVKRPEGWVTALIGGHPFMPEYFLRQIREISVESVEVVPLSDSDRLNGFEWVGNVWFKEGPCREAGDAGMIGLEGVERQRGQWSKWVPCYRQRLQIQKLNGQWQIPQNAELLAGKLPTAEDFAKAGVK